MEIKHCPFCRTAAGTALGPCLSRTVVRDRQVRRVECAQCHARGPAFVVSEKPKAADEVGTVDEAERCAISAWNQAGTGVPAEALETELVEVEYSDGSKGSFEYPKDSKLANEAVGKALDSLLGIFLKDVDEKDGGAT